MLKIVGCYMSVHVIDAHKGYITGIRHGFRSGNADQQCANKARSVRDPYQVDLFCAYISIFESLANDIIDTFQMLP